MSDLVKVKIIKLGHVPYKIDWQRIVKHKSVLFKCVDKEVESHRLVEENGDLGHFNRYSDSLLENIVSGFPHADLTLIITNVLLENNYFLRRLSGNTAVLSLYDSADILINANVPIENLIFRAIYEYAIVYKDSGSIPKTKRIRFTHDNLKQCLFDMNASYADIPRTCEQLDLCDDCLKKFNNLSMQQTEKIKCELKKIKRTLYYRIVYFIKIHPMWALMLSAILSVFLNLLASYVYDLIRR